MALILKHGEDWRQWIVTEPFQLRGIVVPAGFVTDGATIPRIFWSIFPPFGLYAKAAVLHDYCCEELHAGRTLPGVTKRAEADRVFLDAMHDLGVDRITAWTLYRAVRLWAVYRGYP